MLTLYLISNIAILAGYAYIAGRMLPSVTRGWRQYSGTVFFATCAATHIELARHMATNDPITRDTVTEPWHLAIHVVQAIAVVLFAHSFYTTHKQMTALGQATQETP